MMGIEKIRTELISFIESNTYMDNVSDEEVIRFTTRRNGDMEHEEPGKDDIQHAEYLAGKIINKFPNCKVRLEPVDEFIYLEVTL